MGDKDERNAKGNYTYTYTTSWRQVSKYYGNKDAAIICIHFSNIENMMYVVFAMFYAINLILRSWGICVIIHYCCTNESMRTCISFLTKFDYP